MDEWVVSPHSHGWRVLTSFGTEVTLAPSRHEAITKAARMIYNEGGGHLEVVDVTESRQKDGGSRPFPR